MSHPTFDIITQCLWFYLKYAVNIFKYDWHTLCSVLYLDKLLIVFSLNIKSTDAFRKEGDAVGFQKTFKALSDSTRRKILNLLKDGSLSAGEIGEHFDMTGATISHHLNILKEANLVTVQRDGKYLYYELNLSVFEEIISWLSSFKEDDHYEDQK